MLVRFSLTLAVTCRVFSKAVDIPALFDMVFAGEVLKHSLSVMAGF